MRTIPLCFLLIFIFSCSGSSPCRKSKKSLDINMKVTRLENKLFECQSLEQVESFLESHPEVAQYILHLNKLSNTEVKQILNLIRHPSIDTLYRESLEAFKNFDQMVKLLEEGYGRLKAYYPQTEIPTIQTIVSGLIPDGDLYISKNKIIIGIDYFIGSKATFKPKQIPGYILVRYDIEHLPAIIMQFVSSQYVLPGKENTLVSEMIDYGKTYYFLSKLLPCVPERILIGYSKKQWEDVSDNEEIIWANFVHNEILYKTDHVTKQKFLGERPSTYEISNRCPGRIGAWLGWQIVKKYMQKSDESIPILMNLTNHEKIFRASQYKPK